MKKKQKIVRIVKDEGFTNSIIISKMLGVKHAKLLITLESIIKRQKNRCLTKHLNFPQKYIKTTFVNRMGRTYRMYEMNEQAYMKLAMHLKGYEKAEQVQDSIIEAFSLMKQKILNESNSSWLDARSRGKELRLKETDTIKEFVDYATNQGSNNASYYYKHITKMTNKALEFLKLTRYGVPLRDLASTEQLGFIQIVDIRATEAIKEGINQKMHYKDIYKFAKEEVNKLAGVLHFKTKKTLE